MPSRPNILLCVADDAGKHLGAYGCPWVSTPAFDRVAREGLLFDRAVTPNAKCAPSRAALLTGRNSWQLGSGCLHMNHWPAECSTFMEALAAHGYLIGHTNKGWAPGDPGKGPDGRPRELTGPAWNTRQLDPPTSCVSRNDYAANFRDFLEARSAGQPFCFWFGPKEPHRDYEFGSGRRIGGRRREEIDRVPGHWPDNAIVRDDLLDYGLELEHLDRHLGRMLELLEARGELANTLVVVTSDNGLPFPRTKGQAYAPSNELPLAMRWPAGIRAPGRRLRDYVSLIDLAPTFLEVAGVDPVASGMRPLTGRSLLDLFTSDRAGQVDPTRDFALIGKERHDPGRPRNQGYPIRGIFADGWLYLRNYEPTRWPAGNPELGYMNCDRSPTKTEVLKARRDPATRHFWRRCFGKRPAEELFHVEADPDCLHDRARDPECAARRDALSRRMEEELRRQGDPRMEGRGAEFEAMPFFHPWMQDLHERYLRRHQTGEKIEPGWIAPSDFEEVDDEGEDLPPA